jgi:hypothetical protein
MACPSGEFKLKVFVFFGVSDGAGSVAEPVANPAAEAQTRLNKISFFMGSG